ncbi:uncharacterized protein [Littorina saxatilis]|uniref:uncharacterized protein n=1 Tax=Littorina saxatilis TaxID=31220 RepID=UPI0038B45FA5
MTKWDESQDLDFFLQNFERVATTHQWPANRWAVRLADQLTGRAQTAMLKMNPEDAGDYEMVKAALVEEYHKTPDHYRRMFREMRKTPEENFKQFEERMRLVCNRWIDTSGITKDFENLKELILLEQMLSSLVGELGCYVRERKPKSAKEAARIAFNHLDAKRESKLDSGTVHSSNHGKEKNRDKNKQENTSSGEEDNSGSKGGNRPARDLSSIICHKCKKPGHLMRDCKSKGFNVIHTSGKKRVPLWHKLEPLCEECEKIPFRRDLQVRVNGRVCWAMRDTGADDICVKPEFVKKEDYLGTTETVCLAVLKVSGEYPKAYIEIDTPFIKGKVQCIVIDDMGPDVFVGEYAVRDNGKIEQLPVYPKKSLLVITRGQAKKEIKIKVTPVIQIEVLDVTPDTLKKLQREDVSLKRAHEAAVKKTPESPNSKVTFKYAKGILKRVFTDHTGTHTQVCVPQTLRHVVLKHAHDTPMSGHLATKKTRERVWSTFYWPGMCTEIQRYCRSCDRCQKVTPRGKVSSFNPTPSQSRRFLAART